MCACACAVYVCVDVRDNVRDIVHLCALLCFLDTVSHVRMHSSDAVCARVFLCDVPE